MGYKVTGIGGFGFSLNWEKTDGDRRIAESVITFLEDRRILFADRDVEGAQYCVLSANQVRGFLTEQLAQAKPGKSLAIALKEMRRAFRQFVDKAGPAGLNFEERYGRGGIDRFSLALGELRGAVGQQLDYIAYYYGLEVEDELAEILPSFNSEDDDELAGESPQLSS